MLGYNPYKYGYVLYLSIYLYCIYLYHISASDWQGTSKSKFWRKNALLRSEFCSGLRQSQHSPQLYDSQAKHLPRL